jgi:hypothetical protein
MIIHPELFDYPTKAGGHGVRKTIYIYYRFCTTLFVRGSPWQLFLCSLGN